MTEFPPRLEALGLRALVDHAFGEWNSTASNPLRPENHRSRAIPERLGFREEAILRETELVRGHWCDSVTYGRLMGK